MKKDNIVYRNYRVISLLSVVRKIYRRVLVARMKDMTRDEVGEEKDALERARDVCIRRSHQK